MVLQTPSPKCWDCRRISPSPGGPGNQTQGLEHARQAPSGAVGYQLSLGDLQFKDGEQHCGCFSGWDGLSEGCPEARNPCEEEEPA